MAAVKTLNNYLNPTTDSPAVTLYVAKKGRKYIGMGNNELAKKQKIEDAIVFESEVKLLEFIDYACIDDRNAKLIGTRFDVAPVSLPAQFANFS